MGKRSKGKSAEPGTLNPVQDDNLGFQNLRREFLGFGVQESNTIRRMITMAQQGEMKKTLGLTGVTVNAMALIAPGAFLWLTFQMQSLYGAPMAGCAMWLMFILVIVVTRQSSKPTLLSFFMALIAMS